MAVFYCRHGPSLSAWPWRIQRSVWSGHSRSIASPYWSSLARRVPLPVPTSPFPPGCSSQLLWSRWRQRRQPAQRRWVSSNHTAHNLKQRLTHANVTVRREQRFKLQLEQDWGENRGWRLQVRRRKWNGRRSWLWLPQRQSAQRALSAAQWGQRAQLTISQLQPEAGICTSRPGVIVRPPPRQHSPRTHGIPTLVQHSQWGVLRRHHVTVASRSAQTVFFALRITKKRGLLVQPIRIRISGLKFSSSWSPTSLRSQKLVY